MKKKVYVDTNIIIEAFRINCWSAICQNYELETVEKCVEESLTGNINSQNEQHVYIDKKILINGLSKRHKVGNKERANLSLNYSCCEGLDDGELHLFAWIYAGGYNSEILIATADKAAIVSAAKLGWIDSLISLEQIIQHSGISKQQVKNLATHHKNDWLNNIKTQIRLGMF